MVWSGRQYIPCLAARPSKSRSGRSSIPASSPCQPGLLNTIQVVSFPLVMRYRHCASVNIESQKSKIDANFYDFRGHGKVGNEWVSTLTEGSPMKLLVTSLWPEY